MDRVRSDPVRILSMVTLVNCASSCKVFDLAMYFSSKSRKQRWGASQYNCTSMHACICTGNF